MAEMKLDDELMKRAFDSVCERELWNAAETKTNVVLLSFINAGTKRYLDGSSDITQTLATAIHIGLELGYEYARLVHERELAGQ